MLIPRDGRQFVRTLRQDNLIGIYILAEALYQFAVHIDGIQCNIGSQLEREGNLVDGSIAIAGNNSDTRCTIQSAIVDGDSLVLITFLPRYLRQFGCAGGKLIGIRCGVRIEVLQCHAAYINHIQVRSFGLLGRTDNSIGGLRAAGSRNEDGGRTIHPTLGDLHRLVGIPLDIGNLG